MKPALLTSKMIPKFCKKTKLALTPLSHPIQTELPTSHRHTSVVTLTSTPFDTSATVGESSTENEGTTISWEWSSSTAWILSSVAILLIGGAVTCVAIFCKQRIRRKSREHPRQKSKQRVDRSRGTCRTKIEQNHLSTVCFFLFLYKKNIIIK